MDNYKSNSDNFQQEREKTSSVVNGKTKIRKKGEVQKLADSFFAEDANKVTSYIFSEVIVPALKKAVSDVVTTGVDMLLYGESRKSKNSNSAIYKSSYRDYYDRGAEPMRAGFSNNMRNGMGYDDILFDSRGDAEAVLDTMNDIISRYGTVSVADLYDLAQIPNDNFTMNRYGWTNISGAYAHRVRDGYILKLPKTKPLN